MHSARPVESGNNRFEATQPTESRDIMCVKRPSMADVFVLLTNGCLTIEHSLSMAACAEDQLNLVSELISPQLESLEEI